jgi:hypothetical protein
MLVQLQRVSDLVAELAELSAGSELVGKPAFVWRHSAIRLNLQVALETTARLAGPELVTCRRLSETIGVDTRYATHSALARVCRGR